MKQVLMKNVQTAMKARGIKTQVEMAKQSGVDQKTISNLLNPEVERTITLDTISALSKPLKIAPWQLLIKWLPDEYADYKMPKEFTDQTYELLSNYNLLSEDGKKELFTFLNYLLNNKYAMVADNKSTYGKK